MVKRISKTVTSAMIERHVIDPAEREIYEYGFQITLSSVISFTSAVVIGFLFSRPLAMLLFLICFASMRMYSGGYHASSYLICFLELLGLSILVMMTMRGVERLSTEVIKLGSIALMIVSTVVIYALAPVDHENAPLSKQELHRCKRIVRRIFIVHLALLVLFVIFPVPICMPWAIVSAAVSSSIMVIGGYWHRRREVNLHG